MHGASRRMRVRRGIVVLAALLTAAFAGYASQAGSAAATGGPKFSEAKAFDVSKPLTELARGRKAPPVNEAAVTFGPEGIDLQRGSSSALALRAATTRATGVAAQQSTAAIASPLLTFEGLSNQDNFNTFGFRVNPPDPDGDVGPNH